MFGFKNNEPSLKELKIINSYKDADDFAEFATHDGFMAFGDWDGRDEYEDAYEDAVEFWQRYHNSR